MLALDLTSPVTMSKHPSDETIKERKVSVFYCGKTCADITSTFFREGMQSIVLSGILTSLSLGPCV